MEAQRMGLWIWEDADNVQECAWHKERGEEGKKEEHIKKVQSEDYSSSPGKMQARSRQSCEAGCGVKVCEENELERLTEAVLQKPMTLDLIFKVLES